MRLEYSPTVGDYVAAKRSMPFWSRKTRLVSRPSEPSTLGSALGYVASVLLISGPILLLLSTAFLSWNHTPAFLVIFLFLLIAFGIIFLSIFKNLSGAAVAKTVAEDPNKLLPVVTEIDDKGFHQSTEISECHAEWAAVREVLITEKVLMIMCLQVEWRFVPVRVFDTDAAREEFCNIVRQRVTAARAANRNT